MKEHNKTYYSLEELKRARDCYEGYQDGEEVYYFVGALRYACDEIERLNNIIEKIDEFISYKIIIETNAKGYQITLKDLTDIKKELLKLKGVDKE